MTKQQEQQEIIVIKKCLRHEFEILSLIKKNFISDEALEDFLDIISRIEIENTLLRKANEWRDR